MQTHESQRNRNATAITLGLARASLPRTVWHLLCSMRCRTALLAPPATWRNWLRQHSRPSAFPRQLYRSCHVHQFAASSCQLWVSRLFVFPGLNQDCPIGVCCSRVRFACTCQRGSHCDVNRQLGPRVTWEILCQHLNASTFSGWDTHVHVAQERV